MNLHILKQFLRENIIANSINLNNGNADMKNPHPPADHKGRSWDIVLLIAAQILVGFIHVVFGFWLLTAPRITPFVDAAGPSNAANIYSIYTIAFGFLSLSFAWLLWLQKRSGWIGTTAILIFVILADSLTLLDLPTVPGIPKFAGYGEIAYSILVTGYLFQSHIRTKYQINLEGKKKKELS